MQRKKGVVDTYLYENGNIKDPCFSSVTYKSHMTSKCSQVHNWAVLQALKPFPGKTGLRSDWSAYTLGTLDTLGTLNTLGTLLSP